MNQKINLMNEEIINIKKSIISLPLKMTFYNGNNIMFESYEWTTAPEVNLLVNINIYFDLTYYEVSFTIAKGQTKFSAVEHYPAPYESRPTNVIVKSIDPCESINYSYKIDLISDPA